MNESQKPERSAYRLLRCSERLCEKSVMILNNYSCGWSLTSMNHRAGLDRSQTLLFPERLEDYVAAENPVRFLDALRRVAGFARAGFCQGPMRGHGLSALRSGGAAQTVSLRIFAPDSLLAAAGSRMPSERESERVGATFKIRPTFRPFSHRTGDKSASDIAPHLCR